MTRYQQLFESNRFHESELASRETLNINQRDPNAWLVLCLSLIRQNKEQQALSECESGLAVLNLSPNSTLKYYLILGRAAYAQGSRACAFEFYKNAANLDGSSLEAHFILAHVYFEQNKFQECAESLERFYSAGISLDDEAYAKSVFLLSRLPGEESADSLFDRHPTLKREVEFPSFHFGLGNLLVKDKRYKEAFDHILTANRLKRKHRHYDFERVAAMIDRHKEHLDFIVSDTYFKRETDSPIPIFIVGMPRSGSSILEQMLGAHPDIEPLGEGGWLLSAIKREMDFRFNDESMSALFGACEDTSFLEKIENNYYELLGPQSARFVVDKTLVNYHFLQVIRLVFPTAHVIHTTREKGPTVWSCFRTDFLTGVRFSESLEDLSHCYDAVESLLDRWRDLRPANILQVKYESNIENPEQTVRKILSRLRLEYDPACLEPWKQKRIVDTASKVQVTQPIFKEANKDFEPFRELINDRLKVN